MAAVYWQQLCYRITQQLQPLLEEALFAAGAESLSVESTTDSLWLEQAGMQTPPWQAITLTALFSKQYRLEQVIATVAGCLPATVAMPECTLLLPDNETDGLVRFLVATTKIAARTGS